MFFHTVALQKLLRIIFYKNDFGGVIMYDYALEEVLDLLDNIDETLM